MEKIDTYEFWMLAFGMCYIVLGGVVAYKGNLVAASQICASGALLFSFLNWYETRRLKRTLKERGNG